MGVSGRGNRSRSSGGLHAVRRAEAIGRNKIRIDQEGPLSTVKKSLDELCVDTIRTLSIDAVQKANSGHPGLPLGAAPMAYVLWQRHLKHNPRDPHWPDRDRFVLSAGHGCMLLYSLLHLTGYDLTLDDLKAFRQWGSRTPGHPEPHLTPGVEATTGPLGQGTANAVGMAIAERFLAARYNRPGHEIVNHRTFCLVGDGDLMEGISSRGGVAGRAPEARQARVSLRRQPRLARRSDLAVLHRGRPAALRGLRLAGAARRERQHEPRRHRRGDPNGRLAGRPADHHRRADDDRLRLAAQGRDVGRARQPARRRGSGADQEGARLGVDRGVLRAARGPEALPHGARARHEGRGRLGPPLRGLGEGLPGSGRGVAHGAQGRAARRLGRGPAEVEGRRLARDARGRRQGPERDRQARALARRRRRGPLRVHQDEARGRGRLRRPDRGRQQHPLRRARARDGGDRQRHGVPRRRAAVRRDVLLLLRLHAPVHPARGPLEAADDLRLDARLDRPRRGRPDAPGRRAADVAARDAGLRRAPAGRRDRDRAGVEGDHGARGRSDRPRALPPEHPGARSFDGEGRRLARRLHPGGGFRRRAEGDPHGDGLGAARRRRRAPEARGRGHPDARRLDAVLGVLRRAAAASTATWSCRTP